MAIYALKWADAGGNGNIITPDCAGDIIRNVYEADLAVAPLKGVTLGVGDIVDFGIIPANTTVSGLLIDSDDLDSNGSPALAYDVGVISGTPGDTVNARTVGTEFFAATTASQSAAVTTMSKNTGFRVAPVGYDRSIGIKITTAAATQPSTGKLRLLVNIVG